MLILQIPGLVHLWFDGLFDAVQPSLKAIERF